MVIDNFIDDKDFKNVQNFVLSPNFPWFYQSNVSLPPGSVIFDPMAIETFGWNHQVYNAEEGYKAYSLEYFEPILNQMKKTFGDHIEFIRIRLSMKTHKLGFTKDNYNLPHVDYHFPHKTVIFYINDSDGDTWIFNEELIDKEPIKFSVKERINPKANRLLQINGLQYHTASNPISNERRVVLNINYYD